jgi:hypothetical protein
MIGHHKTFLPKGYVFSLEFEKENIAGHDVSLHGKQKWKV